MVGVFVSIAGVEIGRQAWDALRQPDRLPPGALALGIGALSVIVKVALSAYLLKTGRQRRSPALEASGQDFRADAVASLGVLGGVFGARLGWPWLDPLVGCLIALLVIRTGLVVARDAVDVLMDRVGDPELVERVTDAARTVNECRAVEQIHARSMGSYLVVDLVIGVPGHLSVHEGDQVAHRVEAAIRQHCPEVAQVRVHVDPV